MPRLNDILLRMLLLLGAVTTLAACSSDTSGEANGAARDVSFRVRLTVGNGQQPSRADGPSSEDGYRAAFENESRITDATLLFYQADDGVNASADTPILFGLYAPKFNKTTTTTDDTNAATPAQTDVTYETPAAIKVSTSTDAAVKAGTYHVLVLCNMGDYTAYIGKTLGEVRALTVAKPYFYADAADLTTYNTFAMSSNVDQTITLTDEDLDHDRIVENKVNLSVERLAARIDFSPGNTEGWTAFEGSADFAAGNYYKFNVKDETNTETGDIFYLTSVAPFNLFNRDGTSEYVFKRVTQGENTSLVTYLGQETVNATGNGSNYVLTPHTLSLTTDLFTSDKTINAAVPQITGAADLEYTDDDNALAYRVCTYSLENTMLKNADRAHFATGLHFKGYYGKRLDDGTFEYVEKEYDYYIRHTDPHNSNADALCMKYALVRNHVYQISIERVAPVGIIVLEVKDWIPVTTDDIYM